MFRPLLAIAAACLTLAACVAPGPKKALPERVQVSWAPDNQLTEVRNNSFQRGWLKPEDWQKTLSTYLRQRADAILPPGQKLEVKFEDIKLAGDFEPWHGPNAQDIRFMKDIYPPRATLHYRLTDASGATIREGESKLSDLAYLQRTTVANSTDPLRYDKRMLDDWLTKEFVRNQS
ncbi:MAG: DUF3016 domain-containing protein [Proteobacteria bacterium]|nr:DUF3016 domain-containing protein [Pseudomonadota bacterium]MBS0566921.1 DUF3016 domain-containing protein [Pseudomonadota bacterium]